ncbi:MAG: DNA mismatch repair endonuclease MutL [Erysipelotrichaceae bacterium]|nr:DNA mismatch repair endonuclease MutL [Erysipelotrichaceae bacterium]
MAKIRQLDDNLINKIAAGEVVERPANVIKELVENAIDAHASKIEISIIEGGFSSMKVSDNGDGMESVDARLCFMRHATSKIKDDNDLFNIMTLGFRGEAIPSIAAVSHFNLQTSTGHKGIQIDYEFGKFIDEKTSDYPKGTTITVTKLFQNVPARLKYLKSVNSEFSQIQRVVERIALAYPDIAFRLYHNERQIFQSNGQGNLLEVIASMYGLATAKNMIPVHIENDEFTIDGYISKIDTNRATKANIITLVNHRYVKNYMSIDAINNAYRAYLADNRYPIAVVNIQVDPYLVDVNVHPSKLEVRFSKEYELKTLIEQGVSDALKQVNLTYQQKNKETEKETYKPEQLSFVLEESKPIEIIQPQTTQHIIKEESTPYSETISTEKIDTYQKPETLKPIKEKIYAKTQIHGTYMIGENEKGMYLCDQHAAQERINYEYYKEKYAHLDLTMQPLIVPLQLEYPLSDFMLIEERKELLENVGIHLEVFGEHGYVLRSLPLWMKNIDENIFVDEMIQEVLHKNSLDVVAMQEYAIATLSCKASVKGNTYLTMNDMQTIFDNLMRCENPYVCPHGRPTLIFYSDYELEKLFKRVI